jgi:hypothetical protein
VIICDDLSRCNTGGETGLDDVGIEGRRNSLLRGVGGAVAGLAGVACWDWILRNDGGGVSTGRQGC